ncbi:MAG: tetratricopeptide repeat protein [Planctomycetota bacterium]|nr:tetratricopeptide repeat protein [Planctomycetota bacterium]
MWWHAAVIAVAVAAVYSNSFQGPFLFDDEPAIVDNPTIRQLWPPGPMLHPPAQGQAVQRRPVVNVSLAVNYALSGRHVWSYHATNLALHILAALALLGVVGRTLESPRLYPRFGGQALGLATAIAVIWALHPLQTEAVTYVVQRTEVLAGLFYLLTLYAVIRTAGSAVPYRWYAAAVGACLLAMGSKESAVSAPLVVLLYDRIFLAPSWPEVFRKRWPLHAGLAATWVVVLVMIPHGHEGSQIFGDSQARAQYALAQGESIVRYLTLCSWPATLVVDYGFCPPRDVGHALPYLAAIGAILAATGWALWRRAGVAFLGVWFFAILAPSSGLVPLLQQVAAEKRMYLPLAAVVTLAVTGAWAIWTLLKRRLAPSRPRRWLEAVPVVVAATVAIGLGLRTFARNEDYRTAEILWRQTVESRPDNPRAHNDLGAVLAAQGRAHEAIPYFQEAVRLKPDYAKAHYNWANALRSQGQFEAAAMHYEQALRYQPDYAEAHNNWGTALIRLGQFPEAAEHFAQAVRIKPDNAEAHYNWGVALANLGHMEAAAEHFRTALGLKSDFASARTALRRVETILRKAGQAREP